MSPYIKGMILSIASLVLVCILVFLGGCNGKDDDDGGTPIVMIGDYFAGYSTNSGGYRVPCYWKNGTRIELSCPTDKNGEAYSVFVSGDNFYVAGSVFTGFNDTNIPCYWKSGTRTDLPEIDATKKSQASSITVSDKDVYAAGYSINSKDVEVPCYWKNGMRSDLSMADSTKNGRANSIFVVKK